MIPFSPVDSVSISVVLSSSPVVGRSFLAVVEWSRIPAVLRFELLVRVVARAVFFLAIPVVPVIHVIPVVVTLLSMYLFRCPGYSQPWWWSL